MENGNRNQGTILVVLAGILQIALWLGVFLEGPELNAFPLLWAPVLLLHIGFTFLFSYGVYLLAPQQPSCDEFAFGMTMFLPLSTPFLMISFLIYAWWDHSRDFLQEFEKSVFFDVDEPVQSMQSGDFQRLLQAEPLEDILRMEHSSMHKNAVQTLARIQESRASEILRDQLTHTSPVQRLHAFHEVEKSNEELETKLQNAKREREQNPEDPEAHAHLGDCYLDYVQSGAIPGELRALFLERARSELTAARGKSLSETAFASSLARVHLALNNYEKALQHLSDARSEREGEGEKEELLYREAKAQFHLGRYDRVRAISERLRDADLPDAELRESVAYWTRSEPPGTEEKSFTENEQ